MGSNAAITVAFFAGVASVAWSAAFAWAKWLQHRHDPAPDRRGRVEVDEQRVARLERAVDVMAEELERVGEGQRYTARLLEERLPPAPPAARPRLPEPGRVATPH